MESDRDKIKAFLNLSATERGMGEKEKTQLKRIMPNEDKFFIDLPSSYVNDVNMFIKPTPPNSPVPWIGYIVMYGGIIMAEEYSRYPTAKQIAKLKKKYDALCQK
jgi:hypothetical protein